MRPQTAAAPYPVLAPPPPATRAERAALLTAIDAHAEFNQHDPPPDPAVARFGFEAPPRVPKLHLTAGQRFLAAFANPATPYARTLVLWRTGGGKTLAALAAARAHLMKTSGRIVIVAFTQNVIFAEMVRRPELGFVSFAESAEAVRLRTLVQQGYADPRQFHSYLGSIRRRLTDPARGGRVLFYGYKQFAQQLVAPTAAGLAAGFDLRAFRDAADPVAAVDAAEAAGHCTVDRALLAALRGGFVIADEIHNAYNATAANNYGLALALAFDVAQPRVLLMSATPMTGSASEVVDVLNLLVPRAALPRGQFLARSDLFLPARPGQPSRLRPGALDLISGLAAGRVSWAEDTDTAAYPRRIFLGRPLAIAGRPLPFLRFIACPMSPLLARTVAAYTDAAGHGSAALANLCDMVFPAPPNATWPPAVRARAGSATIGLGDNVAAVYSAAPAAWRRQHGVEVVAAPDMPGVAVVRADFLAPRRLREFSPKYATIVADVIAALREPGRMLVYHDRVRGTGAAQLAEVFYAAGFLDEVRPPTPATLCGICGQVRRAHSGRHEFRPARLVVLTSELDAGRREAAFARFIAPVNAYGYDVRLLLGSRVVVEGLDFHGLRQLFVAARPSDIQTLIQLFGRAVRKNSHALLPPELRTATLRVYVTTAAHGGRAPELAGYAEKLREFAVIQETDRALRRTAVDGFLRVSPGTVGRAEPLDGLPVVVDAPAPVVAAAVRRLPPAARTATYRAYGFASDDFYNMLETIRALFVARAAWTEADLYAAARRPGLVAGGPAVTDPDTFALALRWLLEERTIVNAGCRRRLFLRAAAAVDVDAAAREAAPAVELRVPLERYVREVLANTRLYAGHFRDFVAKPPAEPLALVYSYSRDFLFALARDIVGRVRRRESLPAALTAAKKVFERIGAFAFRRHELAGYHTPDATFVLVDNRWQRLAREPAPARRENPRVVGYFEAAGRGKIRFKLRPPLEVLEAEAAGVHGARGAARGAVCESRPRRDQEAIAVALGAAGPAAARMSSSQLCAAIRRKLLENELAARPAGPRWLYFYYEPIPALKRDIT